MESVKNRKSYQAILTSANELFWKYGVKRVSVEEICNHAGVSKMTFYRSFKNKVALVSDMLEDIFLKGIQDYKNTMDSNLSFPDKVKQMIIAKHENVEALSEEFIKDVFGSEEPVWQKLIAKYQIQQQKQLRKDFTSAQKAGWIRDDLSMDFIFYILEDMQTKIHDPQFIALHKGDLHASIMEITNFFFYGVIPLKEHKGE